jgi:hypothetical protein
VAFGLCSCPAPLNTALGINPERKNAMPFRDDLGVITCRCVLEAQKPVLFVSHAGGDWQMYCHYSNHDFDDEQAMKKELTVVHVAHLVARDTTLNDVADLSIDMGAERTHIGGAWTRYEDKDED